SAEVSSGSDPDSSNDETSTWVEAGDESSANLSLFIAPTTSPVPCGLPWTSEWVVASGDPDPASGVEVRFDLSDAPGLLEVYVDEGDWLCEEQAQPDSGWVCSASVLGLGESANLVATHAPDRLACGGGITLRGSATALGAVDPLPDDNLGEATVDLLPLVSTD